LPIEMREPALAPLAPRKLSPELDFGYFLQGIEDKFYPLPDFLGTKQPELDATHRGMLVDWLVEVVDVYQMSLRSAFIAVGHVDRVLATAYTPFERSQFQLLGATCLHVASKCEDVSYIGVEDLASCGDNIYTHKDVLKMEENILNLLQFQLIIPTALDFLNMMLVELSKTGGSARGPTRRQDVVESEAALKTTQSRWAHYLAELALQDYYFAQMRPSEVAAAVLFYARFLVGRRSHNLWPAGAEQYCSYSRKDLRESVKKLHHAHSSAASSTLRAIRKRYLGPERGSVAQVSAPDDLSAIDWGLMAS